MNATRIVLLLALWGALAAGCGTNSADSLESSKELRLSFPGLSYGPIESRDGNALEQPEAWRQIVTSLTLPEVAELYKQDLETLGWRLVRVDEGRALWMKSGHELSIDRGSTNWKLVIRKTS